MRGGSLQSRQMQEKHFDRWIKLKARLHYVNSLPKIRDGEIWWCSFGENIGVEINGKSNLFSRPVFIYKKLSRFGFIGVPLTSQKKTGSWYVSIDFHGSEETAVLAQIRTFSVARLSKCMGELDIADREKIRNSLLEFLK